MSRQHILVVDDHREVADALAMLIKCLGYPVQAVYGGRAALDAAQVQRPDVVFLDLDMPDLDGFETARRLHHCYGDALCLVAHSAHSSGGTFQRIRAAGFDHHLIKPVEVQDLKRLLKQQEKPG